LHTVRHRFNIYSSSCVDLALWCANWVPPTRYTLRRNTASNVFFFFDLMKGFMQQARYYNYIRV